MNGSQWTFFRTHPTQGSCALWTMLAAAPAAVRVLEAEPAAAALRFLTVVYSAAAPGAAADDVAAFVRASAEQFGEMTASQQKNHSEQKSSSRREQSLTSAPPYTPRPSPIQGLRQWLQRSFAPCRP